MDVTSRQAGTSTTTHADTPAHEHWHCCQGNTCITPTQPPSLTTTHVLVLPLGLYTLSTPQITDTTTQSPQTANKPPYDSRQQGPILETRQCCGKVLHRQRRQCVDVQCKSTRGTCTTRQQHKQLKATSPIQLEQPRDTVCATAQLVTRHHCAYALTNPGTACTNALSSQTWRQGTPLYDAQLHDALSQQVSDRDRSLLPLFDATPPTQLDAHALPPLCAPICCAAQVLSTGAPHMLLLRSCDVARGGDAVCTAKVLVPHCVEPALLVGALVGVGAKEVTLGLFGCGGWREESRA
jgi:hypothetical protein